MKYRYDIEGLRAIAVLSVLFFHVGFYTLSGGYTGVDIFFVISGYLITSILIQNVLSGQFSLLVFYERRLRRLYPALFATLFVSWALGYLLFMPDEFTELGQSMVSTTLYLSNVFFWWKSDYFAGPSELKPLLHTWSLAVEEQYYLLFPVISWLCLRKSVYVYAIVVIVLLLASFIASCVYISHAPSAVFYLAPFRFWQLLIGSLVAIGVHQNIMPSKRWALVGQHSGFGLILFPIFYFTEFTVFPGWAAVPSSLGTALVIWSGQPDSLVSRFLTLSPMRFIGKLSYSLYLWHWPIVVFYGYWVIREMYVVEKMTLLLMTVLMSWLSWRYIETPMRTTPETASKPRTVYLSALTASILAVSVGMWVWQGHGLPSRFGNLAAFENLKTLTHTAQSEQSKSCFLLDDQTFSDWAAEQCIIDDPEAEKLVLLWGDSHAWHLKSGLEAAKNELGFDVLIYTSAGCPPVFGQEMIGRPNCKANNDQVLSILDKFKVSEVFLASNWSYAIQSGHLDLSLIVNTVNKIQEGGVRVTVLNQLPTYSLLNPQYLSLRLAQRENPTADYYLKPIGGKQASQKLASLLPPEMLLDVYGLFCPDHSCAIYRSGAMMVIDPAHLSREGSQYVVDHLLKSRQSKVAAK